MTRQQIIFSGPSLHRITYEKSDEYLFFTDFKEPYPNLPIIGSGIKFYECLSLADICLYEELDSFHVFITPVNLNLAMADHIFSKNLFKFPYFTAKFYYFQLRKYLKTLKSTELLMPNSTIPFILHKNNDNSFKNNNNSLPEFQLFPLNNE
jgi:hypothetical protein